MLTDQEARESVKKLEGKLDTLAGTVLEQRKQISRQQSTIQTLTERIREQTGMIEVLQHNLGELKKQLSQQQRSINATTDQKIRDMQQKITAMEGNISDLSTWVIKPSEREMYDSAFADFQSKNYQLALKGFDTILKNYPDGVFTENARYWISNAHYALGDYEQAIAAVQELLAQHPQGNKEPDGLLISARSELAKGQTDAAKTILDSIIESHPTSLAADKAREILLTI